MKYPIALSAAILQVLRTGEAYGLEIVAKIEARTDGKMRVPDGSVYQTLARMEKDGLLVSRQPPDPTKGVPRKYYTRTSKGDDKAQEQLGLVVGLFMEVVPAGAMDELGEQHETFADTLPEEL
jgi:PadR family transcriptional regulator PadR